MCRMAWPLANRFCGQSRTRPWPERIWIRPCASVAIQIVMREGRPLLRPNVVRSTSGAVAAADARSRSAVMGECVPFLKGGPLGIMRRPAVRIRFSSDKLEVVTVIAPMRGGNLLAGVNPGARHRSRADGAEPSGY